MTLEQLTQAERSVLYSARSLARFRQVIFANVAAQYLALVGRKQAILNLENNIRLVEEQIEAQAIRDSRPTGIASEPLEKLPDGFQIPDELQGRLLYEEGWLKWRGPLTEEDETLLLSLSTDSSYLAAAEQLIVWKKQRANRPFPRPRPAGAGGAGGDCGVGDCVGIFSAAGAGFDGGECSFAFGNATTIDKDN